MPATAQILPIEQNSSARTLAELLAGDLDFGGASGKFCSHGWHPFPAKFPPQLPALFIESLTAPGDTVLDPMALPMAGGNFNVSS